MKIPILRAVTVAAILIATPGWAEEKLRLDVAIESAISSHPALQASRARARGAKSVVTSVTTLPAPMLGIGMMGENSPWSNKMQNSYEISQAIPFPTKIISNRAVKSREAESRDYDLDQETKTIIKDVKKAFYAYARALSETEISHERIGLLKTHLKTLSSKPVSSTMVQAHVVTIEGEIEAATVELSMSEQELASAKAELNFAMGKDANSELGTPELPVLSPLPNATTSESEINSPRIKSLNAMKEAAASTQMLARQEWIPDFDLTYRYNRRYDLIPTNHEFMVGVTLPFVPFWSTAAKASEASAKVIEADAELRKARLETASSIIVLKSRTKTLRDVFLKLSEKVLPSAEKRLHLIHRFSQSDLETLDEHRMAFENLSVVKLKIARARFDYELAVAELESLVSPTEGKNL